MFAIEWLLGATLDFGDLLPRRRREAGAAFVAVVLLISPDTFVRVAQARAEPILDALMSSVPKPVPDRSTPANDAGQLEEETP